MKIDVPFCIHTCVCLAVGGKKRRRWGQTADEALNPNSADAQNKRRKSRFGSDKEKIDLPANSLIAAAAANLTPEETKALICTPMILCSCVCVCVCVCVQSFHSVLRRLSAFLCLFLCVPFDCPFTFHLSPFKIRLVEVLVTALQCESRSTI